MLFRDFAEQVKDAAAVLLAGTRGERDPVPMLHIQSRDGRVEATPISSAFFDDLEARPALAEMLPPLLESFQAETVAWTLVAWHHDVDESGWLVGEPIEVMIAVVIDRERTEVWRSPIVRYAEPKLALLGGWQDWQANMALGPLIDPIKEVLR